GAVFGPNDMRIVSIDGYRVDIPPSGYMILTRHNDKPGIIGAVGTLMGTNQVNIAGMHVGRDAPHGRALMVVMVDEEIGEELLGQIRGLPGMDTAQFVEL